MGRKVHGMERCIGRGVACDREITSDGRHRTKGAMTQLTVIIPRRNPSKVPSQRLQIVVCPILSMASAVVVQSEQLVGRLMCSGTLRRVFVDVVAEMDDVVVLVFAGGVTVDVEEALGWTSR